MNIFIDGMQGAGKSTLLTRLSQALPEYQAYREGDASPAELAWCSYMTEEQYQEVLLSFPELREEIEKKTLTEGGMRIVPYTQILTEQNGFHRQMEQYEIYDGRLPFARFREIILSRYAALDAGQHMFECSFFQNTIESMFLYYEMPEEEIAAFYREAYKILKPKGFFLLYLDPEDLRESLLRIRKERVDTEGRELWYPMMLRYLQDSPYGKSHPFTGMEEMLAHFERRRRLELRLIREELCGDAVVLPAQKYDIEQVLGMVRQRDREKDIENRNKKKE